MLTNIWWFIFCWLGEADEDLDEFEVDGFLVDNVEDGGEEDNPMKTQKKKKRTLLYFPAL